MLPKHPRYQTALRPEFGKGVNINYCGAWQYHYPLVNLEVVLFEAGNDEFIFFQIIDRVRDAFRD